MPHTKLTMKQEKFCQFYCDTGIASEAYRMAYDTSNMKDEVIWKCACELLKNGKVAVRISEIQQERKEASKVEKSIVERALMDIVTSTTADLYTVDPVSGKMKMKTPHQLPKRVQNALRRIRNNRGVVDYEFNSKIEAAALLGKWNGWNTPTTVNFGGLMTDGNTLHICGFEDSQDDDGDDEE